MDRVKYRNTPEEESAIQRGIAQDPENPEEEAAIQRGIAQDPENPEEEAAIQRGIAQDPENPEWTDEDFARARPATEVVPEIVAAYRRTRGQQKRPTKVLVSLRLEREVVDRLRASGPGWQSRANDMLRHAVLGEAKR